MMNSEPARAASAATPGRRWPVRLWLAAVIVVVIVITFSRLRAVDADFATANQITYGGGLVLWLITLACLLASRQRRWALALLIVSLVGGLSFLTAFRFERLDGELRPRFSWRWSRSISLPDIEVDRADTAIDPGERFASRSTDSPQFLGPNRSAVWPSVVLDKDWQSWPPELIWKQPIGEGWSSFAVRGDVAVTMEQRDQEEWVSAYDVPTGRLLWKFTIADRYASAVAGNGPRSTPIIQQDRVFACSAVSQLVCLELQTGHLLWSHDLNALAGSDRGAMEKEVNWGRSGSPLVYGSSLIVPLGGTAAPRHSLIAFDQLTGQERWRAGDDQISYSSPTLIKLSGVEQLVYASAQFISGFLPDTGQPLWSIDFPGSSPSPNVAQPIGLDGEHLFFSKGYGVGARIIRVTPPQATATGWRAEVARENRTVLRTKFTNPVLHAGDLYGLSDGILECISADSLQRQWKRGRYHQGQVILVGDSLIVSAEDGRLVLVEPDSQGHRELASLAVIGDVTWNVPTLSGDRLLMRNSTEAACLRLKLR